jgi:hypothetical protein
MNKETLLQSLGYRKMGQVMLKPFGFSMFKYELNINKISSLFYGCGTVKEILTWNSETIDEDNEKDFLCAVSYFEAYNFHSHAKEVNFGFLTPLENAELMVQG